MIVQVEGSNHAMQGAIELGKLSVAQESDIQNHLRRCDKSMVDKRRSAVLAKRA